VTGEAPQLEKGFRQRQREDSERDREEANHSHESLYLTTVSVSLTFLSVQSISQSQIPPINLRSRMHDKFS